MKEFKIGDRVFVGTYVPEGWLPYGIGKKDNSIIVERPEYKNSKYRYVSIGELPPGTYKIMGLAKDLSLRQINDILGLGWGAPHPDDHKNMETELASQWLDFVKDHSLTDNTLIIEKL